MRYLLFERQEHPAHKETFTRIVQLMENETGVQDSGSLTFRFDPSFQDLILHQVQIHRAGNVLNRLDPAKLKFIQPETGLSQHIYSWLRPSGFGFRPSDLAVTMFCNLIVAVLAYPQKVTPVAPITCTCHLRVPAWTASRAGL